MFIMCVYVITAYCVSISELTFGKIIGCGSFAKVYKGVWRENTVALKTLRLPGSDALQWPYPKEVEILKLVVYS